MKEGKIRVSNTNGSARQRDAVRVYLDNAMIAEVYPPKCNPLKYLKDHPKSLYRQDLAEQLDSFEIHIDSILNWKKEGENE
jgi:adenylylsulfate kinase-like enzyme